VVPACQHASNCPDDLLTLGHAGSATFVAATPDGTRIVTGSYDRTTRVWDAMSGAELAVLKGHTGGVNSLCVTGPTADTSVTATVTSGFILRSSAQKSTVVL
jgi:WD40 repeat protein